MEYGDDEISSPIEIDGNDEETEDPKREALQALLKRKNKMECKAIKHDGLGACVCEGAKIETVPLPEAEPPKPKRSRARKAAAKSKEKAKPSETALSLIRGLDFVSVCQKKAGPVQLQFCKIGSGWICASNEILTAAHPIAEDLEACPNTLQFLEALKEGGKAQALSITQLTGTALAVTSAAFRGLVPCVDPSEIKIPAPDPVAGQMGDSIKAALRACGALVSESAQFIAYAAVLLKSGVAVGCTGQSLIEYWHGFNLPEGLLIPKTAALAVADVDQPLTGFGFSPSSLTFYFENGAFIKTQLYAERYPDYSALFAGFENVFWYSVPKEFFEGLKALEPFGKGYAFFENETLYSDESKDLASSYKVEGLPGEIAFNIRQMLSLKNQTRQINFETDKIFFKGEDCRGVMIGKTYA